MASPTSMQRTSRFARLTSHIPPGQFGRYLLVGGFNTAFGYGTYAVLTALLDRLNRNGYILAGLVSPVMNITAAYLNYKFFVFKTKGNYFREWLRCLAVYSGAILLGTALLPVVVFALRRATSLTSGAPYVAGALLLGINVIFGFLGHKKFTFRQPL
jgi:putative flippase GtrA